MTFRANNLAILAKLETTEGTDAVPTGAANAIQTAQFELAEIYGGDRVSLQLDRSTLGASDELNVNPQARVRFRVMLAGAGAAGTAPKYGPLMIAAGMSETINAGVSVVYAPAGSFEGASTSLTFYAYHDGQLHKLLGARGTWSIGTDPGGYPYIQFDFVGSYVTPTAAANPALTLTGWQTPLAVTKANTPTFTVHGYAAVCKAFSVAVQNAVSRRTLINYEGTRIGNRNVRGSMVIEAPALASKNYFTAIESHTAIVKNAIQLIHGLTAGNIVQIDGPKVQLDSPGAYDRTDGILGFAMNTIWTPNAGNDEITITVK